MKPSDDAILLAFLLYGERALYADEVRGALQVLGWELSAQQVASTLRRLSLEQCPAVEAQPAHWYPQIKVYSLTRFGRNQLGNRWPKLRPLIRELEAAS